jgi:hypothetical protein
MKALLYKNALLIRKQMKTLLALIVLFCLIPSTVLNLGGFALIYAAILFPTTLMSLDEQDKWLDLAGMLPYSTRDLVLSHYLTGWLTLGLGVVSSLAGLFLFSPGHVPDGEGLGDLLLYLSCGLICQAILFPLLFRFGTIKGRGYLVLVVAVFFALLGTGLVVFDLSGSAFSLAYGWLLLLALVLAALSLPLSFRCFRKRQGV